MRRKIIAGNWKMNLNGKAATDLIQGIAKGAGSVNQELEILVFPSFVHLKEASDAFRGTNVKVGAQNIYPSAPAAFTGEISCEQLKDLNIQYVLVGHSERRQFLKETDSFLNEKVKFILSQGMIPVLCIGETLEERESNKTFSVVETQLKEGLKGITDRDVKSLILAYEPVWAIGTGKVATPEQAEEVHAFIRKQLIGMFSAEISQSIPVLYGGSVKPDNIKSLMEKPNIDGGLVGGASQKADSYLALFQNT
jgi:triosephosphate isomerase